MAKNETTGLMKLLEEQLQDAYYFEKQLLKALPKMAKKATNAELKDGFLGHKAETEGHVQRIEQIFEALGKKAKAKKCPAMDGLLQEGNELMEDFADDPALDAALVAAAQKVEHYEIATYGNMKAWAEQLGLDDVAGLLEETLEEEKACDEQLTTVGESVVNAEAEDVEDEEEDGDTATATKRAKKK